MFELCQCTGVLSNCTEQTFVQAAESMKLFVQVLEMGNWRWIKARDVHSQVPNFGRAWVFRKSSHQCFIVDTNKFHYVQSFAYNSKSGKSYFLSPLVTKTLRNDFFFVICTSWVVCIVFRIDSNFFLNNSIRLKLKTTEKRGDDFRSSLVGLFKVFLFYLQSAYQFFCTFVCNFELSDNWDSLVANNFFYRNHKFETIKK